MLKNNSIRIASPRQVFNPECVFFLIGWSHSRYLLPSMDSLSRLFLPEEIGRRFWQVSSLSPLVARVPCGMYLRHTTPPGTSLNLMDLDTSPWYELILEVSRWWDNVLTPPKYPFGYHRWASGGNYRSRVQAPQWIWATDPTSQASITLFPYQSWVRNLSRPCKIAPRQLTWINDQGSEIYTAHELRETFPWQPDCGSFSRYIALIAFT